MTDVRRLTEGDGLELAEDALLQLLTVRVRRNVVAYLADLASSGAADKGAGLVAVDTGLTYAAGTVGALLKTLATEAAGFGNASGPGSAIDGDVAVFDGTTGKLLRDSGLTLAGTNTGDETAARIGALVAGASAKTTPAGADMLALVDASGNIVKRITWTQVLAVLSTMYASSTGAGTVTSINVTAPAAGLSATGGPITSAGAIALALANDLAALEGLAGTGLARRTGSDTWSVGTQVATSEIADSAVTYAKLQNVAATARLLGRKSAGSGVAEELTLSDALDLVGSAAQGDILYRNATTWTRLGAGTSGQFLQTQGAAANPVWATVLPGTGTVTSVGITAPAAGITISGGPITSSGTFTFALADDLAAIEALSATGLVRRTAANTWSAGTTVVTAEIADQAVTYAKLQNVAATARVLGRKTAGAGTPEELTLSDVLDLVGSAAQGDILYRGATTWQRLAAGTAGQQMVSGGAGGNPSWATEPFDVVAYLPGLQTSASQKIVRVKVARALAFAANFSGSYFTATANAAGSTVFTVYKNDSTAIGTVTIGAGGTTATFATTGGTTQSLAAGDVISIVGPATADTTLADAAFTLAGTR